MTRRQRLRLIFHEDTMALIGSLIFLWITISLFIDTNFDAKDLLRHTGNVVRMDSVILRVKDKPLFKEILQEFRVTINTEDKYFTSVATTNFDYITSKIKTGDKITVFTKPRLFGIFGIRKKNEISQLIKADTIVIDYDAYKETMSGLFYFTLFASIVFFIIYYSRTRKRYIFNILSDP